MWKHKWKRTPGGQGQPQLPKNQLEKTKHKTPTVKNCYIYNRLTKFLKMATPKAGNDMKELESFGKQVSYYNTSNSTP